MSMILSRPIVGDTNSTSSTTNVTSPGSGVDAVVGFTGIGAGITNIDRLLLTDYRTVTWQIVIMDLVTAESFAAEIYATHKSNTQTFFSVYSIIGDVINVDIDVIVESGTYLTLQLSNNTLHNANVFVKRIPLPSTLSPTPNIPVDFESLHFVPKTGSISPNDFLDIDVIPVTTFEGGSWLITVINQTTNKCSTMIVSGAAVDGTVDSTMYAVVGDVMDVEAQIFNLGDETALRIINNEDNYLRARSTRMPILVSIDGSSPASECTTFSCDSTALDMCGWKIPVIHNLMIPASTSLIVDTFSVFGTRQAEWMISLTDTTGKVVSFMVNAVFRLPQIFYVVFNEIGENVPYVTTVTFDSIMQQMKLQVENVGLNDFTLDAIRIPVAS